MPEILFLSPYFKLPCLIRKIMSNHPINYEIIDIPSLDSVDAVKKVTTDAKVIISRGGTAKLAKHYTHIPVVEIPVTLFDILDACDKTAGTGDQKKAVITSANIIYETPYINKIRELQIEVFSSENWLEERIQAEEIVKSGKYDVIIGDSLAQAIAEQHGILNVLIESGEEAINQAVDEALRILTAHKVEEQIRIKNRKEILDKGWVAQYSFRDVLGQSSPIQQAVKLAKMFAKSDGSVLITGETGTGKELFAQSIHNESDRLYGPFISVNCSAINDNLLESELFGYDSGAFTGASKRGKRGLFECANNGTILFDEIGEMSIISQAKLLRVLQERKLRRIGSEKITNLDMRMIFATNRNLLDLVERKEFRKDLYYRLSELELFIPPLRERPEDIILLAEAFLKKEMSKNRKELFWFDRSCFRSLLNYLWPGNIRELRNFIVKVVAQAENEEITHESLTQLFELHYRQQGARKEPSACTRAVDSLNKTAKKINVAVSQNLKLMEQDMFHQLLLLYGGNKEKLCADYGISKITLWRKLNYKNLNGKDSTDEAPPN